MYSTYLLHILLISAKIGIVALHYRVRCCCEISHCSRTCTYRSHRIKGSSCLCVFRKAVMIARAYNGHRKALIHLILSTRACIVHCLRWTRRRGIVTRHRMHATRLAAALEVAVKAVERHCRLHLSSYTERSSNSSAFVAVCARSFYLGLSWPNRRRALRD